MVNLAQYVCIADDSVQESLRTRTGKIYVDMMAQIAKRHGIEELVQSFLLWGPADTAENVT